VAKIGKVDWVLFLDFLGIFLLRKRIYYVEISDVGLGGA
jgi:hypothetical protein